jgi:hypothetical protein
LSLSFFLFLVLFFPSFLFPLKFNVFHFFEPLVSYIKLLETFFFPGVLLLLKHSLIVCSRLGYESESQGKLVQRIEDMLDLSPLTLRRLSKNDKLEHFLVYVCDAVAHETSS